LYGWGQKERFRKHHMQAKTFLIYPHPQNVV
jgi:hypothetical protein